MRVCSKCGLDYKTSIKQHDEVDCKFTIAVLSDISNAIEEVGRTRRIPSPEEMTKFIDSLGKVKK